MKYPESYDLFFYLSDSGSVTDPDSGLGGGGETVPFVGGLLLHLFFDLLAFSALEKLLLLIAIRRILRCKGVYIGPFFLVRIMT